MKLGMGMSSQGDPDDFDIAKAIASQVKDLSAERKERIFRWVAESIGLTSLASRPAPAAPAHPAAPLLPPSGAGGGRDIKTFIASKDPKGDTQFAAAVAYYYRFEAPTAHQRETINAEMLQESTRLAGRSRFSNPLSTLNNAKRSGYLDSGSPGEFVINSVGENLVAMTLPGGAQNSNGRRPAITKKKAAKKKKH
jgi:hypothetical protein